MSTPLVPRPKRCTGAGMPSVGEAAPGSGCEFRRLDEARLACANTSTWPAQRPASLCWVQVHTHAMLSHRQQPPAVALTHLPAHRHTRDNSGAAA